MKNLPLLTACVFVTLSATPAHAAFIDGFDTVAPAVAVNAVNGFREGSALSIGGGMTRTLATSVQVNPTPATKKAWSVVDATGAYGFSSDASVDGYGQIDYRFDSMDLTGLSAFRIDFRSNDSATYLGLTLGDANTDALLGFVAIPKNLSPFTVTIVVPDDVKADLDLAHLTNFSLWVDTSVGGRVSIDKIQSVPEPASMAALAVGALGLLRRRRKA